MSLLLQRQFYTFSNVLCWGCFKEHAKRSLNASSSKEKFLHGLIAAVELIPVLGQIVSLCEKGLSTCFTSHITVIRRKKTEVEVSLPKDGAHSYEANCLALRSVEKAYLDLPWPKKIKKIVFFTDAISNQGDIVTSVKIILLLQKMDPDLEIDWVVKRDPGGGQIDPQRLLVGADLSRISIRKWESHGAYTSPADLLIVGPAGCGYNKEHLEKRIHRRIRGPIFQFGEIALWMKELPPPHKKYSDRESLERYFQPPSDICTRLSMGLKEGTGVLFDPSRAQALLTHDGCCSPEALQQIQDPSLRKDILHSMNVFDGETIPDYSKFSFNSGYVHHMASRKKFIDCVAMHEREKEVVVVLNQKGSAGNYSTEGFEKEIFTPQRIQKLQRMGYGKIVLKGADREIAIADGPGRSFTVIVRPSFLPGDMTSLQIGSERLVATGDNSAVESLASRSKLFLYEDAGESGGCKRKFLQQQVDLAAQFSPTFSRLLALFGGDARLKERHLNEEFTQEAEEEVEKLLSDKELAAATKEFCSYVISNFDFAPIFEGALKRALWLHLHPELWEIEAQSMNPEYVRGLAQYVEKPQAKTLHFKIAPDLGARLRKALFPELIDPEAGALKTAQIAEPLLKKRDPD